MFPGQVGSQGRARVCAGPYPYLKLSRFQGKHSLLDFQGAQEEPDGRPGGPGNFKTSRVDLLFLFYLSVVLLALPLALR